MKNFFRLLAITLAICANISVILPAQASVISDSFKGGLNEAAKGYDTTGAVSVYSIAGLIIQTLLSLLGVIFVVLIIYAGTIWMTAEGDESKVEKAQKILRNAIIGLIIVVASYAISVFVVGALSSSVLTK